MTSRAAPTRSPAIPAGLSRDQLLEIYYYLRLTRTLEERLVALYRQTKVVGGLYRSLGQEGESVASAYALERGSHRDILSPLIRNLGSMLVMGAKPVEIPRQYMAKGTSPTRGREMNVHFNDLALGYLGQISHLGDMIPVMAGITLSFKLRGEPRVGLVYIGDGGTSTGTFHEGLNFAAVQRCPLVVIGEYNRWAYSTPPERQFAVANLADKAKGYGVPAVAVDGNDVFAVYEATRYAVGRARLLALDQEPAEPAAEGGAEMILGAEHRPQNLELLVGEPDDPHGCPQTGIRCLDDGNLVGGADESEGLGFPLNAFFGPRRRADSHGDNPVLAHRLDPDLEPVGEDLVATLRQPSELGEDVAAD